MIHKITDYIGLGFTFEDARKMVELDKIEEDFEQKLRLIKEMKKCLISDACNSCGLFRPKAVLGYWGELWNTWKK